MVDGLPKKDLQIAPMHRIIKKAGAERVSDGAARELRVALEEIGVKIAKEALDFTRHAHRKTVKSEDIRIAVRRLLGD
ncbi:MAG: histone family protein [Candidatus Bathyarchaeia archaeon]